MQVVYEARDSIDARIVAGLLESHGLECRVDGEHLQGAMGELPAMGLVRLLVHEEDVAKARALIEEREEAATPERRRHPATESGPPRALWVLMAAALVIALWLMMQGGAGS